MPALNADEFAIASQLADVVTSEVHAVAVAHVKTHYRRPLKKLTKWLSSDGSYKHRKGPQGNWKTPQVHILVHLLT